MTGVCATCGKAVPLIKHRFFSGPGLESEPDEKKARRRWWAYHAALYHLGNRNFCGPECVKDDPT